MRIRTSVVHVAVELKHAADCISVSGTILDKKLMLLNTVHFVSTISCSKTATENWKIQTLPLARIKKIMKSEEFILQELEKERLQKAAEEGKAADGEKPSVKFMISGEAPVLMSKACELLIKDLSFRAWRHTERNRRRTLQRQDLHAAVGESEVYDFLIDIVPRVTTAKTTAATAADTATNAAAAMQAPPPLPPGMPLTGVGLHVPASLPTGTQQTMATIPAMAPPPLPLIDNTNMMHHMQQPPQQQPQQHYQDPHHQQHHHQQHQPPPQQQQPQQQQAHFQTYLPMPTMTSDMTQGTMQVPVPVPAPATAPPLHHQPAPATQQWPQPPAAPVQGNPPPL